MNRIKTGLIRAFLFTITIFYAVLLNKNSQPYAESVAKLGNIRPAFNCSPRAIQNFPASVFTDTQLRNGALIIHFLVVIYMFIGISIVCDQFFVPCLEHITTILKIQPDVAGATFMAAGSSAPELATTIIGVFVAKDDIGLGAVVGSADYNIMFVIGLCALFVPTALKLNWWPLVRDCIFYSLSIIVLALVIADEKVTWYESMSFLILYALYILLMYFNSRLERCVKLRLARMFPRFPMFRYHPPSSLINAGGDCDGDGGNDMDDTITQTSIQRHHSQEALVTASQPPNCSKPKNNGSFEEDIGNHPNNNSHNQIRSNNNNNNITSSSSDTANLDNISVITTSGNGYYETIGLEANIQAVSGDKSPAMQMMRFAQPGYTRLDSKAGGNSEDNKDGSTDSQPVRWTDPIGIKPSEASCFTRVIHFVSMPLIGLLIVSIPNCQIKRFRNWWPISFLMSCAWIAVYSYMMIWMISIIGFTLSIPDSVMGLTFIAAGSSVPDAIASVIVVKQGEGDMAISNAVGSNVFDILVCMGLPWLIKNLVSGSSVYIYSRGLVYATITLLSTVFILLIATHCNGWQLTRRYGILLLIVYVAYLVLCSLYELNVFGKVHLPECSILIK